MGKGWISSASSVASTTANGDYDIHIGRFTDIQFASDVSYPTGVCTLELASKDDSSERVGTEVAVEEVSRHGHEAIEMCEL